MHKSEKHIYGLIKNAIADRTIWTLLDIAAERKTAVDMAAHGFLICLEGLDPKSPKTIAATVTPKGYAELLRAFPNDGLPSFFLGWPIVEDKANAPLF